MTSGNLTNINQELVLNSSLLRGLSREAIADLTARANKRRVGGGQFVYDPDESPAGLYCLVSGKARVVLFDEDGRELVVEELRKGELFGRLWCEAPSITQVVATEDATLLYWSRQSFADHIERYPQTALNVLSDLSARLRRADELIADLGLCDVESRLLRTLRELAQFDGQRTKDGWHIARRPTQQDLAARIGSCRETISRTLSAMAQKGIIVARGRSLFIPAAHAAAS